MERAPINMAKLDHSSGLLQFAAAASAVTLTSSQKLIRNSRYYKTSRSGNIYRDDLANMCRAIRQDAYGLQNLMMNEATAESPFLVALSGKIYDQLEELHRSLLFFDPGSISDIIPFVDQQRRFWEQLTDPGFYSPGLLNELEYSVPHALDLIRQKIDTLPVQTAG